MKLGNAVPRGNALTVVLGLVLLAAFGWFLIDRLWAEQRATTAEEQSVLAEENAEQIAAEVRSACEREGEIARELGDLCRKAEVVEQKPTAPINGIDGRDGQDGRDGRDGRPGRAGVDGRDGDDGRDGRAGVDGTDGTDGTRGLSCVEELGLEACRGDMGATGAAGPPGPECPDGSEAQPTQVRVRGETGEAQFVDAWLCLIEASAPEPGEGNGGAG